LNKLPPIPQAFIAGGLAALATGLLIWGATITGLFETLHVPVASPPDALTWMVKRMFWGALAGLLFMIPLLSSRPQWKRGALASIVPIAVLLLVLYPQGPEGWLGINLGLTLLAAVIVFWVLWGIVAGAILDAWGFGGRPAVDESAPLE
jgi:hypothetical protein